MKYRLKDRELQRKLDALSDENQFSDHLQRECESVKKWGSTFIQVFFGPVAEPFGMSFTANFRLCDIEEVREHDPTKWNNYPEVTPPEGVWMRCETDVNAIEHKIRHVAKFDGREWRDYLSKQVVVHRFRPWEDEE